MGLIQELGYIYQMLSQTFPPTPTFHPDQIPDLTGRVCIVTGGYSGIGKETARALLKRNARVYIAARSKTKAISAIQELQDATGNTPIFLEVDLASLASVREAASEFLKKEQELHVLFNNAGIMMCPVELLTADGYDMQFGTNVIGHWYLTELLMPALLRGKESSPDKYARVITTSSISSYVPLCALRFNTLKDTEARRNRRSAFLYGQSKMANILVAREVARRYGALGIISIAVNPGNIDTDLYQYTPSIGSLIGRWTVLHPPPFGALTQLFAGTMPEALQYNGEFMVPWARPGRARAEAYDEQLAKKLWEWLEEQVKTT